MMSSSKSRHNWSKQLETVWASWDMTNHKDDGLLPADIAPLPNDWTYKPLASLVDQERGISYGIVQPGAAQRAGVPIVRVNNLKQGRVITDDVLHVSPEIESKYSRTRLRGSEVLVTLVGTLGEWAVVPIDLAGWNVARAIGVIPVTGEIDPRWVALCLRSQQLQHYMRTWATTTVQATLNLRDVAKLPIPIPPKDEREAITHILGTLDDKIELNRRMNETLEAIARRSSNRGSSISIRCGRRWKVANRSIWMQRRRHYFRASLRIRRWGRFRRDGRLKHCLKQLK